MNKFTYGDKTYKVGGTYYTDYPFVELGDEPYQFAPIRSCQLLDFDGNKYATVSIDNIMVDVKAGYLHKSPETLLKDRESSDHDRVE